LEEEGTAMNHCAAEYRSRCGSAQSSLWSLTVEHAGQRLERLLTVEVHNSNREIVQVRGRFNRLPQPEELAILSQWTQSGGPRLLGGVPG
jgi:hypothetical protein